MTHDRRHRLESLIDGDAVGRSASRTSLICARCVSELAVTGAGASVLSKATDANGARHSVRRGLVHATNSVSASLDDLQLTLGEGPCFDAFDSGGPILVADLSAETARWPAFSSSALDLGAQAVFSFPLQIGVIRLGSLDLYRDTTGPLVDAIFSDALVWADLATDAVIQELEARPTGDLGWLADPHAEVHQASGMLQVQLGTNTEEALLRLRAYAYAHDLPLAEVAHQVVTRQLRFSPQT